MKHQLDWSSYRDAGVGDAYADIPVSGGDFARAVAVCINSRRCENRGRGVMCPSYRITEDPNLSTGGRVRLLKAALNTDAEAHHDDELARSMALCVGCKGCKRECDNAVDMAMIKVEYLAQRFRREPPDRRTRMLARLPLLLHRHPSMSALIRWRNRVPPLAWLGEMLLGISARRTLPEPVAHAFFQQIPPIAGGNAAGETQSATAVVLFVDSFTNRFAPQIATAAIAVLNGAGYRVIIASPTDRHAESGRSLCCGRTLIAHGLIDEARGEALRVITALLPHVEAGHRVIGLEPACLLAIRDDYRYLGLGEAAEKVANAALLFEEFVAREMTAGRFLPVLGSIDTGGEPLLVHGHCHQKAVGAMKSMRKVLKAIPGLQFKLIEASCCGMAGSFGIEAEHADLSMQMAEQALLPALREHPEARVLANGFSCRHQIGEATDRPSVHLAELLRQAMVAQPE